MLQSAKSPSDQTILKNANTLRHHFTPRFPFHNALVINKDGEIEVLDDQFRHQSPLHNTFTQEKYIMMWHFGCLQDFIKRRLKEIAEIPLTNLSTHYKVAKIYENLTFLCENYVSHLLRLKQVIAENEKQSVSLLPDVQKLIFDDLDKEWRDTLVNAQILVNAIKRAHKEAMTKSMLLGLHMFGAQVRLSQPLPYKIGHFTLAQEQVNIIAHFEHQADTFRCKDLVHVDMQSQNPALSLCTLVYPAWSEDSRFAPLTLNKLEECPNGPTAYLKDHIAGKWHVIGFKPASLIVTMKGHLDHTLPSLSYFQFMVELGLQMPGRFEQVVFYGPNTLAPIAYAAGFRSNDQLEPNLEQQKTHVAQACRRAQAVEQLTAERTLFDVNMAELYRPFYFDLSKVGERNVVIPNNPEGKQKTSYANLIKAQRMLQEGQSVLPDFYGIPSKPFCHTFNALRTREISGKLPMDELIHSIESIDLNALGSNKDLETVFPIESSETVARLIKKNT